MNIDKVLDIISISVWVLLCIIVSISFYRDMRNNGILIALRNLFVIDRIPLTTVATLIMALILTFLSASLLFVLPQEVGVVISAISPKGYRDKPIESGIRFVVPLVEQVYRYPIYWQTYTMSNSPMEGEVVGDDSITSRTKDGQEVKLDCSVIFRVNPNQAVRVHIAWQNRYSQDLVRARTRGLVRSLVAKYTVDEVNSIERANLETELNSRLGDILEDEGFELNAFVLRNIAFTPEYSAAVEAKQVASQGQEQRAYEAEQIRRLARGRADEVTILANARATAVVVESHAAAEAREIRAEAESKALLFINQAITRNSQLLVYEYINKLSPNIKAMLLPHDSPLLIPIPSQELFSDAAPTGAVTPTNVLTSTIIP